MNELGALGIERRRSPRPIEQGRAELFFQRLNLLADGRSREIYQRRGAGKAAMIGDGEERLELPGVHDHGIKKT